MDNYLDLIKLVLPQFIVDHFDLVKSKKEKDTLHLYFKEFNIPPKEQSSRVLISKGFHKEISVQDFPLRGSTVYLARGAEDGQIGDRSKRLELSGPENSYDHRVRCFFKSTWSVPKLMTAIPLAGFMGSTARDSSDSTRIT